MLSLFIIFYLYSLIFYFLKKNIPRDRETRQLSRYFDISQLENRKKPVNPIKDWKKYKQEKLEAKKRKLIESNL